jgi:hypothetical protein
MSGDFFIIGQCIFHQFIQPVLISVLIHVPFLLSKLLQEYYNAEVYMRKIHIFYIVYAK